MTARGRARHARRMRTLATVVLAAALAGCGGGGGESLTGAWMYNGSANAEGLWFHADGTYEEAILWVTSSTTANAEKETGTYTADGSTFTVTPVTSTCPTLDPAATYSYRFASGQLVVSGAAGVVSFVRQPDSAPVGTFAISYGCNENGTWVPAQF